MGSSAPRSAGAQRLPGKTSLVLRSYFSFVLDCGFEFEMSVSLLLTQQKDKPRPLLAVPPATTCFLYFVFGFVCVSLSQHKWKVSVVRVHLLASPSSPGVDTTNSRSTRQEEHPHGPGKALPTYSC